MNKPEKIKIITWMFVILVIIIFSGGVFFFHYFKLKGDIDEFYRTHICLPTEHGHNLLGLYHYCTNEANCYDDFLNWSKQELKPIEEVK